MRKVILIFCFSIILLALFFSYKDKGVLMVEIDSHILFFLYALIGCFFGLFAGGFFGRPIFLFPFITVLLARISSLRDEEDVYVGLLLVAIMFVSTYFFAIKSKP